MDEMQPEAQAPESDDMIVDQIGALLQKLSPEKQQALLAQLGEMISGAAQPMEENAGHGAQPVGM